MLIKITCIMKSNYFFQNKTKKKKKKIALFLHQSPMMLYVWHGRKYIHLIYAPSLVQIS